jgi:hypothetical protein
MRRDISATKEQEGGEEFPTPAVESEQENARPDEIVLLDFSNFHWFLHPIG